MVKNNDHEHSVTPLNTTQKADDPLASLLAFHEELPADDFTEQVMTRTSDYAKKRKIILSIAVIGGLILALAVLALVLPVGSFALPALSIGNLLAIPVLSLFSCCIWLLLQKEA